MYVESFASLVTPQRLHKYDQLQSEIAPGHSSVGRASDCRHSQRSDGPWFDSGCPDLCFQQWRGLASARPTLKRALYNAICRDPGSNRGPSDLQSDALPAELSRLDKTSPALYTASSQYDCARQSQYASAGNRARVTSMATMYSTTRPLMPCSACRSRLFVPARQALLCCCD